MPECQFKPGDLIVKEDGATKMVAEVLAVRGPLMDIKIKTPPIGRSDNVFSGGWKKVDAGRRCRRPPRVEG